MALIEIDVMPMTGREAAKWVVKINSKERSGIDDVEVGNLSSWRDALEVVRRFMEAPVNF